MCGAATCRGFIGKRKAMPAPKVDTPKKHQKGQVVNSKVRRIVQGRITKVSKQKVKAQVKNGKVVKATIVTTRKTVKAIKKTTNAVTKTVKINALAQPKKTMALGKRKRLDLPQATSKVAKKSSSPTKLPVSGRIIAKPVSKSITKHAKSPATHSSPARDLPLFDTVSHRSRKRNVR
jgi:hypothetical protein